MATVLANTEYSYWTFVLHRVTTVASRKGARVKKQPKVSLTAADVRCLKLWFP